MELHAILEKDTAPSPGLWYVLSASGDCPSMRVGHTCCHIPGPPDGTSNGFVLVVGGANPSGPFNDTYILNLDTFSWDTIDHPGLKPRYEHTMFVPKSQPDKVYVFAGADQGGNHNDIQVLDLTTKTWSSVSSVEGKAPSQRTFHTCACVEDRLYVYSGGQSGSDPVGDRQTHYFDAVSCSWNVLATKGDPPKPRHGHVMCAVGNKIFLHGGMTGATFYDDLHILDLDTNTWRQIKQKKGHPSARAGHGGFVVDSQIYVFGGMNKNGALDDAYKLDTGSLKWERVEHDGPPPACRLDFASCVVQLKVSTQTSEGTEQVLASGRQAKEVLDQQLSRLSSAGSVRSSGGSAGSQRSAASAGSTRDDLVTAAIRSGALSSQGKSHSASTAAKSSPTYNGSSSDTSPETEQPPSEPIGGSMDRVVDMLLVLGGMDTESEIFDDCMVLPLS